MEHKPRKLVTRNKINSAPKQGSVGYWAYIIIFIFIIPFISMGIFFTMLFYHIYPKLFVLSAPLGFVITYYFVWKVNKILMAMSKKDYNKCFKRKKNIIYVDQMPENGSVGYWCYIGFCTFIIPFILITAISTIILYALSTKFFLVGPLIGLAVSYIIARYKHNKISGLNRIEYREYFAQIANRNINKVDYPKVNNIFEVAKDHENMIQNQIINDEPTWNQFDPAKPEYWYFGPGKDTF